MSSPTRSRNQNQARRRRLLARDPRCQYCHTPLTLETSTLDHIIPRRAGGANEKDNFALACYRCNHRKGGDLPEEVFKWASRILAIAQGI